jgi:hypothetical protein
MPCYPFSRFARPRKSPSEQVRKRFLGTETSRISSDRVPHRCRSLDALSKWVQAGAWQSISYWGHGVDGDGPY